MRSNNRINLKPEEEFLLQEYDFLKDSKNQARVYLHTRFAVYITIYALFVSNIKNMFTADSGFIFAIYFILLLIFFIIGVSTYLTLIEHNISITSYMRDLNKIRNYFVSKYDNIEGFIGLPIHDDTPPYGHFGFYHEKDFVNYLMGFNFVVSLLNSFLAGALPFILLNLLCSRINQITYSTDCSFQIIICVTSLICFVISLTWHFFYKQKRFKSHESKYIIKFPSP